MILYSYATLVAVLLFRIDCTNSAAICPQGYVQTNGGCATLACPSTHYWSNGSCQLKNAIIPCEVTNTCLTTTIPQPCPVVAPSTTVQCPTSSVMLPCPAVQAAQPCPVTSVVQPCPITQVSQPCPVIQMPQPCPAIQVPQPCPVTQVTQPCPVTQVTQPCPVTQVTQPCTTTIYVVSPPTQPQPTPSPLPPPPPPPTQPPQPKPTSPPPAPTTSCPSGTILINGYCHLIYCGRGIYQRGKCIVTVCPEGTVWNGSRCKMPEAKNHTSLHVENVIITNINQTSINPSINYTNNIDIFITEEPIQIVVTPPTSAKPEISTAAPENCCFIIPPPACSWNGDQYMCKSRKHKHCGPICTREYIYLSPPPPPPLPPLPPPPPLPPLPPPPCQSSTSDCGYSIQPHYADCNRCEQYDDICLTYCRRPICRTRSCQTMQLRTYCESYPHSIGCQRADGCTYDWCGGY